MEAEDLELRDELEKHKLYEEGVYSVYCIPSKELAGLKDEIKRWSGNRKEIKARVEEIKKYQALTKHVNGTIHFACLEDEGLVCYEGNHRFRALTRNCGKVIVDIMWNATQEDVKREFQAINSAQAVSEIYMEEKENSKKEIENYVESVATDYPQMVGKKNRANRPMFVCDDLKNRIHELYKHFSKKQNGGHNILHLVDAISFLNQSYVDGTKELDSDLKPKGLQKARESGFLLYCSASPLSVREVRWALENF